MTLHSRRQRSTPFLQRNILQGMGSNQSSAEKAGDTNGHNDTRAHKRRRLDSRNNPEHALEDIVFQAREVGDLQRNLRVQVNRILPKEYKRVNAASCEDVINLKARCKVMLSHVATKTGEGDVLLYCNSQLCEIRSFKDPGGPLRMARICLPRPFYIPEASMRVNRDDNGSFDLADSYRLCVELEAAGPTYWPPIVVPGHDFAPNHAPSTIHWVLTAASSDLFSRRRTHLSLKVKNKSERLEHTDHVIDVDMQWATAFEAGAIRHIERGVQPSITVSGDLSAQEALDMDFIQDASCESPPETPGKALRNGHLNGRIHEDVAAEEETTPSRSLRTRAQNTSYNLKELSDKAGGRKRRKQRRSSNSFEEGSVHYILPREHVNLDSYRCITCGQPHRNLALLRAHLKSQHAEYEYESQPSSRGAEFHVSHRYEMYTFGAEPFSLRRPVKAFDLDQYADGNISFVTSRLEMENNSTSGATVAAPVASQQQGRTGRHSSTKRRQTRSAIMIPDNGQTLYDPITRATLQPGTEYKKPAPSDQWLIQWHRDALADFSDVPPAEMEYMQEWDKYMLTQRISSNIYFPRAWLNFVKLKGDWLLSSPSRMVEFGKHLTYLLARSSLDHDTVEEALEHIAACRKELNKRNDDHPLPEPKQSPQGPHVRKSAGGCQLCGLSVLGPRMLLCANEQCTRRLYHSDCASENENTKMNVDDPDWLCNQCCDKQPVERERERERA
ncbi:hypothetical protein CCHL11_04691 [Colletotrichum chlorophyti]|uniref:Zinc finger PHD-type domain-containing protein n=1 Tax=Colletotrichum chlorophyti TaxID=708187 RepID=A0A1Q8S1K9_9PEZI|nr:hypothetical protein CCHL11_04691 [Colletotrichum chlorophyti]